MHRRPPLPAVILLVLGLGYAAYSWWPSQAVDPRRITASGMLEGDRVLVAAEVTGRVASVAVTRGETVERGSVLVTLDDSDVRRRYRQSLAGGPEQQLLELQLAKYEVKAPTDGIIGERAIEPGEVAVAGAPLLAIEKPGALTLVLYVSERQIGRVRLGQVARLTTDSFPGESFAGTVEVISSRAEFTPRNIQTPKDRAVLVYAVRARVPNADGRLKAGMPVDAEIMNDAGQ